MAVHKGEFGMVSDKSPNRSSQKTIQRSPRSEHFALVCIIPGRSGKNLALRTILAKYEKARLK